MIGKKNTNITCCVRCGKCCINSSPALHKQDLALITDNIIKKASLYTLRAGEVVNDSVNNSIAKITRSIIKIKEGDEKNSCLYFDKKAKDCTIYNNRPSQCVSLKCWDTEDFLKVFKGKTLEIADIVSSL